MKPLARHIGMAAAAVALAAVLAAGCGRPKVDCDDLCKRWSECAFEYLEVTGKISKSMIKLIKANDKLRKKTKKRLRKDCKHTCKKWNKKGKWTRSKAKNVKGCVKKGSCEAFAKCIKKYKI